MTQRRPPEATFENWIEVLIKDAQQRGEFSNLPGQGRPLPDVDTRDPDWWLKEKLRLEGLSITPDALELQRAVERFRQEFLQVADERSVRQRLLELNERIRRTNATTTQGPPTRTATLDEDLVMATWKKSRRP